MEQPPANPGIVICEPVAPATDAALAHFGAGCGRWLFLTVGGHAEIGQTPLWSEVDRARAEMGRTDLRLALPDAALLATKLGVTHAAIGSISGDAQHCTLVYQLYAMPSGTQTGPSQRAQGTEEQIIAALPDMATRMAQQLGVTTPRIPTTVGVIPAELGLIGSVAWGPDTPLTAEQETAMSSLAARSPLAGLLALKDSLRVDPPRIEAAVRQLMGQAPDNPLVLGQISYVYGSDLIPYESQDTRLCAQYPHSYALARIGLWMTRSKNEYSLQLPAAARMVDAAPHSPDAWLGLSATLGDTAQSIRKGKYASDITPREQAQLDRLYPAWQYTAQKTAQIDPQYGEAWNQLAQAATFDGDMNVAKGAFWKALRFSPYRAGVYSWGLEMFQDKWGGDPATLAKVAHLATADHYPSVEDAMDTATALYKVGFDEESTTLAFRTITEAETAIDQHFDSGLAHWDVALASDLASELSISVNTQFTISEYQKAVALLPNAAHAHYALGLQLSLTDQGEAAIQQYREALRVAPRFKEAHYELGMCLKGMGRFEDAVQELHAAANLDSQYPDPYYGLGVVAEAKKDRKGAITEYRKAITLKPYYKDANERLFAVLDEDHRWNEALAVGITLVKTNPDGPDGWVKIAGVFLETKAWDNALAASDKAIQADAKNAAAHMIRAKALLGKGSKAKARIELKKVLTLDSNSLGREARQYLAKNS